MRTDYRNRPREQGLSLLELMISGLILSVMVASAFDLFSMQRHQVADSERALLLHTHAVQRLAEEESRLNVLRFPSSSAPAVTTAPFDNLGITEAFSVAPMEDCTGLWKLTIELTYPEGPATGGWSVSRTVSVSRLVADRERLTRLPASVRSVP